MVWTSSLTGRGMVEGKLEYRSSLLRNFDDNESFVHILDCMSDILSVMYISRAHKPRVD